jgi:hypothetical protein
MLAETWPVRTISLMLVAGMNQNPPADTISNPVMMPPLYPSFVASQPAGIDIRK